MSLLYSILPALFNGFPDFTAFFIAMARGNGGKLAGLTEKVEPVPGRSVLGMELQAGLRDDDQTD